ncbi:MAG: 4Fe-4S binding protein [Canidatus Methanoxibalbensis ujae]|nr:4Fe-4S binding protein [Candidatus Methanoxibalbensis ujae]MCW7079190.1 4Fe-4S binding protein [Candidatus Methanoxibalbensis ujae]
MKCFACVECCPTDAIKVSKDSCVALGRGRKNPISVDYERCNGCDLCNRICPMGNIKRSANGCSFCIICMGRPNCVLQADTAASFTDFARSFFRFVIMMCRVKVMKMKKR